MSPSPLWQHPVPLRLHRALAGHPTTTVHMSVAGQPCWSSSCKDFGHARCTKVHVLAGVTLQLRRNQCTVRVLLQSQQMCASRLPEEFKVGSEERCGPPQPREFLDSQHLERCQASILTPQARCSFVHKATSYVAVQWHMFRYGWDCM